MPTMLRTCLAGRASVGVRARMAGAGTAHGFSPRLVRVRRDDLGELVTSLRAGVPRSCVLDDRVRLVLHQRAHLQYTFGISRASSPNHPAFLPNSA